MAKAELTNEQKKERKLQKLSRDYTDVDNMLHISGKPVNEQIHDMVNACLEIQSEICKCSDSIKIDDLLKVQDITESIDKKTYLDFVNISVKKTNGKLNEKAVAKFEGDFANRLVIANLRHSFLESYMADNDLKITDENNYEYKAFSDYKSDEFAKILEDSSKTRMYINEVLYKRYKKISNAAAYITKLELTHRQFKDLVDWEYYKEGGYPTPSSPARLWSIFNRFNEAYRLMKKYDFTQQNELCNEFGLETNLKTPNPVEHPWMLAKDKEEE